ncbi:MAG: chromate transporter [Candidatus Eremiobacteraeota bacterium]|nr:chromate transporter [Candidatus Eremiobacteraeota bacterium]
MSKSPDVSYFDIFKLFFKIGTVGFGGGPALISIIQQEVVDKKKWLEIDDYLHGVAISLIPPGSIMVNIAFFCGHMKRGFWGGVLAVFGILLPSFFLMIVLAMLLLALESVNFSNSAVKGMAPAVVGVLVAVVLKMACERIDKWWGILFMVLTLLLIFYMKTPPFLTIFLAIAIGAAGWHFVEKKRIRDTVVKKD